MSHDLYQNQCYTGREPAWHNLGVVNPDGLAAVPSYQQFGVTEARFEPLYFKLPDERTVTSEFGMMVRPADNEYGWTMVSDVPMHKDWHTPSFLEVCQAWDAAGLPVVDTLGILNEKKGNRMFVTVKLPTTSIVGEEYQPYLALFYCLDGRMAHRWGYTFVRVVCANTWTAALNEKDGIFKIRKNSNLLEDMQEWFGGAYANAREKVTLHQMAMENLVRLPMTEDLMMAALEVAVPVSNLYLTGVAKQDELRVKAHEAQQKQAIAHKAEILERYESSDTEADFGKHKNTAYHFLGAYTEWADHYAPARNPHNRAMNAFTGVRSQRKVILTKWLLEQVA